MPTTLFKPTVKLKMLCLLGCVLAVTLLGTALFSKPPKAQAAGPNPSRATQSRQPKLKALGFYYNVNFDVAYHEAKAAWRNTHPSEVPPFSEQIRWANTAALGHPLGQKPLHRWAIASQPAPWVIQPKVQVFAPKGPVLSGLKIKSQVKALWGHYYVQPQTMLTDYRYLRQSAAWQTVSKQTLPLEALAPGQAQWITLSPVNLLALLAQKPAFWWPGELEVTVTLLPGGSSQSAHIQLLPDHFALPYYLY